MLRFGSFEVDAEARRLSQTGQPVHLTPKAFDLLSLLIDAAPRVVSKEEIHESLWPSYAVSDATLAGLIKELRRALGDSDPNCRIIRTVHRVGYAFDAPVEYDHSAAAAAALLMVGRRREKLTEGENLIGRDPSCDIWIDNVTVSRRHARIVIDAMAAELEDLRSKNGTRIGDERLDAPRALQDGDHIRFGVVDAVFRDVPSAQPTQTHLDMED